MARRLWNYWVWYRSPVTVRPDNYLVAFTATFYAAKHCSPLPQA